VERALKKVGVTIGSYAWQFWNATETGNYLSGRSIKDPRIGGLSMALCPVSRIMTILNYLNF